MAEAPLAYLDPNSITAELARRRGTDASMTPYQPSWQDWLGGLIAGQGGALSNQRRQAAQALTGSTGLGVDESGLNLVNATPVGSIADIATGFVQKNPAAVAIGAAGLIPMPGGKVAGRAAARAVEEVGERAALRAAERAEPSLAGLAEGAAGRATPEPPLAAMAKPAETIEGLSGALAPAVAPVRGQTGRELVEQQQKQLTAQEQETLQKLSRRNPTFSEATRYMTPGEVRTLLTPEAVAETTRLLNVIPDAARYAATGKLGMPKEGWYRASSQALVDTFGAQDAPRFASLLAATSPQTSVESNLQNTLNIWKNWTAAGRPTDPGSIKAIMGQSVQGTKGEGSVLGAWLNNTVRALAAEDPRKVVLSGPKVDSFYRNLADDVHRITLDAHMANMSGISQDILRQSPTAKQLAAGNPGYSPAYAAMGARVREGGERIGLTPDRAQETNWSVAMPLNELQKTLGLPAREILQRGLLTPERIRGTPDFATLLKSDPRYSAPLEAAGYGEQLAKLKPYDWPPNAPSLSTAEQNEVMKTAKTLEELQSSRGREARALVPGGGIPDNRVTGYLHSEAIPGPGTGHHEGLIDAPLGQRESHAGRANLVDDAGYDPINRALGLDPLRTRSMTGSYEPQGGPLQAQPGRAMGFEVPFLRDPAGAASLPPDVKARLDFSSGVRSAGLAQHATPYTAFLRDEAGPHAFVPKLSKLSEAEVRAAKQTPGVDLADTGLGVNVLNWKPGRPTAEIDKAAADLGIQVNKRTGAPLRWTPSENLGDYGPDMKDAWARGPNSGAVTSMLLELSDKITPAQRAAADRPFRETFGRYYDLWAAQAKRTGEAGREDLMRLLEIGRDKGLRGIRAAFRRGDVGLPAIVAVPALGAALSAAPGGPGGGAAEARER